MNRRGWASLLPIMTATEVSIFSRRTSTDDTCNLYHNNGDGTFTDVTFPSGIAVNSRYVGWGCGFLDYDNDGWPDLMQINGHVYPEIDGSQRWPDL